MFGRDVSRGLDLLKLLPRQGRSYARNLGVRARSVGRDEVPGLLSLIVPVYDVERYLGECLHTLRHQDWRKVEIIVVDDGTPDNSVAVARSHQRRDPRVRIVHRPNGGLSAARNTGVAAARGEFIAFVDSDDTVPTGGYAAGVSSLLATGSDFAVMPYRRLRGGVLTPPPMWIRRIHAVPRPATTVEEFPDVQANAIACSKIFRRRFWLDNGIRFVEGIIYEDQQVSSLAYTRARSVDVLSEPVYHWRRRDDNSSISQDKGSLRSLRAQFAAANESLRILQEHGSRKVVVARARQLLNYDMVQFLARVPDGAEGYWQVLRDQLPELITVLGDDYAELIAAQLRILHHLVLEDRRQDAISYLRSGGLDIKSWSVTRHSPGALESLPGWDLDAAGIPEAPRRLAVEQTRIKVQVNSGAFSDDRTLELAAWAFIENVDLSSIEQRVTAEAVHLGPPGEDVPSVPLTVHQHVDHRIAEQSWPGSRRYDPRHGGVLLGLDLSALAPGAWKIHVTVEAGRLRRSSALNSCWPSGNLVHDWGRTYRDGPGAVVRWDEHKELVVHVLEGTPVLHEASYDDGRLRLRGSGPAPADLALSTPERRRSTTVAGDGQQWTAELEVEPGTFTVTCRPALAHAPDEDAVFDPRALVRADRQGTTVELAHAAVAVVDVRLATEGEGALIVDAVCAGPGSESWVPTFEATAHTSPAEASAPDRAGRVTYRLPLRQERWGVPGLALLSTFHRLRVTPPGDVDESIPTVLAPELAARMPLTFRPEEDGRPLLQARAQHDRFGQHRLVIAVSPPLEDDELGEIPQQELRDLANAGTGGEPSIFFRSLYGEVANDSALALHQEIHARGLPITTYWSVVDHSVPLPPGAVPLVEGTRAWHERLGGASYSMFNVHQPAWLHKPAGQVMVQTFHGYPYKGMGRHWWRRSGLTDARIESMLRRAREWDHLVSPASYATEFLREAFYDPADAPGAAIAEIGYPRNDVLLRPEGDVVRARTRELLGIGDRTAVLYAPTFRDHLSVDGMTAEESKFFDPAEAARALGDRYVVLVRGHAFNARGGTRRKSQPGVVDVTYYPDVTDLILASDAAVLDYSSLRFDYALTRKPMLFLVPDVADYHERRPAVLDYAATAPGPHLATTAEVVALLRRLDDVRRDHGDAVETFIATYCDLEDGDARVRLADLLFGPAPASGSRPGDQSVGSST